MANENDYDGGEIKILEGLEAVRKRPGMYIGSTSASGLHHLVWEIVDNSVDEAMAGFCTEIQVTVHADNSITVVDNGRGIPVDEHPVKKIPTLEVVMTILHAGGKFDNSAYKVSGGLHGVGISVVNALSRRVVVQVRRDGNTYEMEFSRGKTVKKMEVVGTSDSTGTTVTFWPDDEIFETCIYDFDTLHNRLQETAFLNKNLKIVLTDERESTPHVEEASSTSSSSSTRARTSPRPLRSLSTSRANRTRTHLWPRWARLRFPCSGIAATARTSCRLPTTSTPPKAACTLRASAPRSPA